MFVFTDYIFNEFFTTYDKASDPNKDANGKGTAERFNNCIEAEIDQYLMPLVANMQPNLREPLYCFDTFIPYLESMLGYDLAWVWFFAETLAFQRNLLAIIIRIYQIRGTIWAHEVMFAWMGLDAVITEQFSGNGTWDDGGTWDDDGTWDDFCESCSPYSIALTGSFPSLSDAQIVAVNTIIEFNKPINAILTAVTYNGGALSGGILVTEDFTRVLVTEDFSATLTTE